MSEAGKVYIFETGIMQVGEYFNMQIQSKSWMSKYQRYFNLTDPNFAF